MTLAEDIVGLFLRERHRLERDVFDVSRAPALESESDIVALARRAESAVRQPAAIVRLVLQALAVLHRRVAPSVVSAALVATLPKRLPPMGTAATSLVVREMLRAARDEIVLLGYEVSEPEIIEILAGRARQGIRVILIVDHDPMRLARLTDLWPDDAPVRIYAGSENQLTGKYASVHGKSLLVDQRELLITSANFTHHGHEENVELGARIEGPVAQRARSVIEHLVVSGIVEPVAFGVCPAERGAVSPRW